jgi:diacylglycerol kinase (ATP)
MTVTSQPETISSRQRTALHLSPDARSILISMNPRAGSRSRHDHVADIGDALTKVGFNVHTITDLDALSSLACEGQKTGDLRAVLAVGGDGTASVVRNHVPLEIPLLIVPMGTENLLGKYLRQSLDPAAVTAIIQNGVVAEFDLGRAGHKYFLLMITAGFDAEVIRSLHENRRGNINHLAYFLPTLRSVRSYRYPPMRLYLETASAPAAEPRLCRWLFGFNLPLYAFGLPILPHAVGTDGILDVCTFERGAVWSVARYLWHIVRKLHLTLPDASVCQTRRFRLEPAEATNIPYQLDGDYGGTLPVDVDVLPGQLRLLVSPETASRLGFRLPTA